MLNIRYAKKILLGPNVKILMGQSFGSWTHGPEPMALGPWPVPMGLGPGPGPRNWENAKCQNGLPTKKKYHGPSG